MAIDTKTLSIIELGPENIEKEHIGCAIGTNGDAKLGSERKKAWMRQNFAEGYRFWRLNARGKALIEGTPGQHAWAPIIAENWFFIDCFWVSGQFKGQGVARRLLQTATSHARAQGMLGLCAITSQKKRGFLSDKGYYAHAGFAVADTAPPDFELMALAFDEKTTLPSFKKDVKNTAKMDGITIFYSHHCPHTEKYLALLKAKAAQLGVPFEGVLLSSRQAAQNAPCPFTTWAMFHNGSFVTNEIFSEGKLVKYLESVK